MRVWLRVVPWLALALLLPSPPGSAATMWFGGPNLLADGMQNGRDVVLGDIDLDGDPDLIVTLRQAPAGNVILLVNVGSLEYVPLVVDGDFVGASDAEIGDLDADGDLDIVVCGSNKIRGYRNIGSNTFTAYNIAITNCESYALQLIDLDQDGDLDIVGTTYNNNRITLYQNDGGGNFNAIVIGENCSGVTDVAAADLDEDGDMDFAATAYQSGQLFWYENRGTAPFTPHLVVEDLTYIRGVATGDFDGDRHPDLAVAAYGADSYLACLNDGAAQFSIVELELNAPGAYGVLFYDVDNDGDDDIFGYANYNSNIFWYEYDTNGQNLEHSIDNDQIGHFGLAIGRVDGDDIPDVVAMAYGLGDLDRVQWWPGFRAEEWTGHPVDGWIWGASDVAAADFDLDGDMDLCGAGTTVDQIVLYQNSGDNVYVESTLAEAPGAYALWVEDMNGDGLSDVLCAASEANDVRLYLNQGGLSFSEVIVDPQFGQARSVHACDLDNDDDFDILATARVDDDVAWYENTGTIWQKWPIDTEFAGATDARAVDLDQDGDLDVVACGQIMDQLVWYRNDGARQFTRLLIAAGQNGMRSAVAADFDRDGDLDIAGTLSNAHSVAWWQNDGSQSFTRFLITGEFEYAADIEAVDLDGNSTPDLVCTAENADSLAWFANDGAGNFTIHLINGDFERARGIAVADLNLDGRYDIAAAANHDSQIVWWENTFAIPLQPVALDLEPNGYPVVIPQNGGSFAINATIARYGPFQPFDAWTVVTYLPTYNAVVTSLHSNLNLNPGVYTYHLNQYVPAAAPAGNYIFSGYLGIYPWVVFSHDGFGFHKNGGVNQMPVLADAGSWFVKSTLPGEITLLDRETLAVSGKSPRPDGGDSSFEFSPAEYALSPAYPNPFNAATAFTVMLPASAELTVAVFNVRGQRVAELAHGRYPTGTQQFTLDASGLPSGLYFVHAAVPGELNVVRKVTLMK